MPEQTRSDSTVVGPASDQSPPPMRAAEDKLARLGVRVEAMQAVLVRLLQEVVRAESRLDQNRAVQLVEANEQLVLAALSSQADAQASAQALAKAPPAAGVDELTRLPDSSLLLDRFAQASTTARRRGSRAALLFVDLDHFTRFNAQHGRAIGDRLLRQVADRMVGAVREVDTVSRYGSDKFLVLLAELGEPGDAQAVAEKLNAAISRPAVVDGHAVLPSASIGIALYPDDGEDIDTLIARADAAICRIRHRGPGGIAFHSSEAADSASPPAQSPGPAGQPMAAAAQDAPTPTAAEQLQTRLREANEQLVLAAISAQELKDAAELARHQQTAFLAAVAEELRNPDSPIRITAAMLGRAGGEAPLLLRVQDIVEQQTGQMARLVAQLVDVSNLAQGGVLLDRRQIDLSAVIDAAVASHQVIASLRQQRVEWHRPSAALWMQGDAARLQQAIGNLLDNASKYSHEGGRITLRVEADDTTITLRLLDQGIGISPHMLENICEPFVLDPHALGFNGSGLGIGLTVARALVKAHGGSLVARSAGPQRGSEFILTLPRAPVGAVPIGQTPGSS